MPIFVFLRSSLLCGARQRPVRQRVDFRPFLRRDVEKTAAVMPRSLSASLRPSPTIYDARARAQCMSRLQKAHFGF